MDRAPRLTAQQRIAGHMTRLGRFRRIDPSKGRRPPTVWALLGRLGWLVLVEESLRRAWRRSRRDVDEPDAPATTSPD